jgi:hypothetical protein
LTGGRSSIGRASRVSLEGAKQSFLSALPFFPRVKPRNHIHRTPFRYSPPVLAGISRGGLTMKLLYEQMSLAFSILGSTLLSHSQEDLVLCKDVRDPEDVIDRAGEGEQEAAKSQAPRLDLAEWPDGL